MKINWNIDLNNLRKCLSLSAICCSTGHFFRKKAQFFLLAVLFFSALGLVGIWYEYIFHSDWDERRVEEYIKEKQDKSEAVFSRENFQKVINETKARSTEFEKPLENVPDIFRLNK